MKRRRPSTVAEFLELASPPRVIAHRGFSGRAPQNTLAAFELAVEVGADMVELDVLRSADGALVVLHDPELEVTTNGTGRVSESTLAELRTLDAGVSFSSEFAGEPIPTLEQVLDRVRDRILVNVEIKSEALADGRGRTGVVARVLEVVRERQMLSQVLLSSFDPRALAQARALQPEMATASLFNEKLHADMGPVAVMEAAGSRAFHCSSSRVDDQIVAECHAAGSPVFVYTVNEPPRMTELLDLGVDGLFTDWPDRLLEHLGRRLRCQP